MPERRDPLITSNVERKRALFIRLDKIGDLVLTLPVDEFLDSRLFETEWVVSPIGEFVVRNSVPIRKYYVLENNNGISSFKILWEIVRARRPDIAFVFQAPWWVGLCVWLARIPERVGVLSQWHSFLFFNCGVRQRRSEAIQNEFDYNKDLVLSGLKKLEVPPSPGEKFLRFNRPSGHQTLNKLGLKQKNYIVVHPGMAGSARNWSSKNYTWLLQEAAKSTTVVITGGSSDLTVLQAIREEVKSNNQIVWLDLKLSGEELLDVLQGAKAVVAPSTGVAHLAAALGVKTLGLYSPVRVQHPRRWGPRGRDVRVFVPQVECHGHFNCLMEKCSQFDCMDRIQPSEVLKVIVSWHAQSSRRSSGS